LADGRQPIGFDQLFLKFRFGGSGFFMLDHEGDLPGDIVDQMLLFGEKGGLSDHAAVIRIMDLHRAPFFLGNAYVRGLPAGPLPKIRRREGLSVNRDPGARPFRILPGGREEPNDSRQFAFQGKIEGRGDLRDAVEASQFLYALPQVGLRNGGGTAHRLAPLLGGQRLFLLVIIKLCLRNGQLSTLSSRSTSRFRAGTHAIRRPIR